MARYCPPGVFCVSDGILLVLGVGLLFLLILVYLMKMNPSPTIILPSAKSPSVHVQGDSRYERAPQPLQSAWSQPEFPPRGGLTSLPINIPTQGLPDTFQSVGFIQADNQVLPLYGRRTAGSRDRWNYYTRTDTYNPVPVPVQFGKRDCMSDVGCQEVMSGESVHILGKEGKTQL